MLNDNLRFELLRKAASYLLPGYRFTWPTLAWWQDAEFNAYLKRFDEDWNMNTHRRWEMYQLARLAADVDGDTAECGVFKGAGSWLILKARGGATKRRPHWLFDSFEGLSAPSAVDGSYWTKGNLSAGEEVVRQALAEFSNIRYMKGWIPAKFPAAARRTFAFVHIDVDLHDPTRDCMEFFYPRMKKGGIIVLDDYGFLTCPGARKAVDDFMKSRKEKIIELGCGSAFILKS